MLESVHTTAIVESPHEMPLRCEALPVHVLRQGIQRYIRSEAAYANTYRCSAVQVQFVRKVIHAEVFTGITLFEGARRATPVRVQGKANKGNLEQQNFVFCFSYRICMRGLHVRSQPLHLEGA